MADKDEFKFDDDDTFPETDLSGTFSEGEQSAPVEPDYPMTIKKAGGGRTKLLLLLLLLLAAGGGAYYYFMMEEPPPPSPPAKKVVVAPKPPPVAAPVAAPAQPAAPAPTVAPAPSPATVSVAPPPKPAASAAPPAPAASQVKPATAAPPTSPAPAKPAVAVALPPAKPEVKPAPAAAPVPVAKPVQSKPAEAKPVVQAATGGPWLVEAGTFLNPSALKSAEKKLQGLGYEPQVSTTQKNVRMTRLRIGSFPAIEVKEALAYARGIAPDAFALRSGETFTIYAGTFTTPQNIKQMTERLASEGVKVEEELLEVKRTISLVRFGGFANQAAAEEAAARARKAGIAAEVVKPR